MILLLISSIIGSAYAIIIGIGELLRFIRVKKAGELVQGKIIDFKEDRSGEGVTYPAIVTYTTSKGEKIIATSRTSTNVRPRIGEDVFIVYSSNEPSQFYFQKSSVPFLMVPFILMFGIAMILLIVELCKIL